MTELRLVFILGKETTDLKLTITSVYNDVITFTKMVELIAIHANNQTFGAFKVCPFVKDNLNVGRDIIDIKETKVCPQLAFLDTIVHCYENIEMIL